MITLTEPGFYQIPAETYHADPCPEPSLSGSIAIPLVHRSPYHAWFKHPRLNPRFERENSKRMDLGTACHSLLFEAGKDLVVIEADDYRSKAAQSERDAAYAEGKTPVIRPQYEIAEQMAGIARARLVDRFGGIFTDSRKEAVLIWREDHAWCRAMLDCLGPDLTMFLDYKTTSASARPEDAERSLYDLNYHFKAAFYERGLNVLDPENEGRRRAFFFFQETDPPFECSLLSPDEAGMTIARKQMTFAIDTWKDCIRLGQWPGYSRDVHYALMPPWVESKWMQREISDVRVSGATAPTTVRQPVTEITL